MKNRNDRKLLKWALLFEAIFATVAILLTLVLPHSLTTYILPFTVLTFVALNWLTVIYLDLSTYSICKENQEALSRIESEIGWQ